MGLCPLGNYTHNRILQCIRPHPYAQIHTDMPTYRHILALNIHIQKSPISVMSGNTYRVTLSEPQSRLGGKLLGTRVKGTNYSDLELRGQITWI